MSAKAPITISRLKAPLLLAGLLLLSFDALAAVKVERARIGASATSMRVMRYGWCQFSCLIENSDPAEHKIQLRVVAGEGQQSNIFTDSVSVPAKTSVTFHAPVMVENSEKYNIEVFVDGRKLPGSRENEMLIKILTNKTAQVAVLDDSGDSLGSFNQLPSFKDKLNITSINSAGAPESYLQYKDFQTLLLVRPALERFNSRQIRAISEYVAHGGTLVFADPKGTLEAAKSPLSELLPSEPLRIRQIDKLPSLAKVAPSFKDFGGHPIDFLESVPEKDGFDVLSEGSFSVIRCKRFGLGICKLCAIAPSESNFQNDKTSWESLIGTLFAGQRQLPDFSRFSSTLDQMTGFKAPGLGTVRLILGSYLLILILVIVAGFLVKKSGLAWAAAALVAALASFVILESAKTSASKKGKLMTSIKVYNAQEGGASAESYCAFFSDSNFNLDVLAKSPDAQFSGMMPNLNSFLPPGMAMGLAQQNEDRKIGSGGHKKQANPLQFARPIDLKRDATGLFGLQSINVASNSSRQFMVYESFLKGQPFEKLPELSIGTEGLSFQPWSIPPGLKFDTAFLVLPNSSLPLESDGQTLRASSGQSLFQSDLISKGIRESLETGCGKPNPYVALIGQGSGPLIEATGNASKQGRSITIIPVAPYCADGKDLLIPDDAILLQAGDSSTRMTMDGNHLKSDFELQGPTSLTFAFALPSFLPPGMEISELVVKFSYSNGGNIKTVAATLSKPPPPPPPPPVQPGKKAQQQPKLPLFISAKGVEREPGVFVFGPSQLKGVVDSRTGMGMFQIEGLEKNPSLPESIKMRANKWSPLSISISVKGSLPEGATPFKF